MQFTGTMGSRTLKTEHGIDPTQPWLCRTSCNLTRTAKLLPFLDKRLRSDPIRYMYVCACMYVYVYVYVHVHVYVYVHVHV